MKKLLVALLLSTTLTAEQSIYGSLSRQMVIRQNVAMLENDVKIARYRAFRREVARNTVTPTIVVVSSGRRGCRCY